MNRVRIACGVLAGTLLVLAGAPPVAAQQFEQGWIDPRIISPAGLGPRYSGLLGAGVGLLSKKPRFGVSAGEFILQPRFFLESEYRSNFFRVDTREADPEGVVSLHVRPGVALFNPDYNDVAMSLGVDLDVFVPMGDERVADQLNLGGVARLAVALFPRSTFSVTLYETFERTLWMRPQVNVNANRNHNVIGADLSFHPGGRALDFTLGYAYELMRYDDIDRIDSDAHRLRLLASWRFYPLTYAFLESTLAFNSYTSEREADAEATGNLVPSSPLRVYAGLSGFVTERLALLLRVGYGNSFLDRGEDFSSFIGMAQASWRFSPRTILHVGIARDFEDAALGGYVEFVRPYIAFTQRFGELAELSVDFAYDIRSYGTWQPTPVEIGGEDLTPVATDARRSEGAIRAGFLLDFDLTRLFGATLGYRYDSVVSDYAIVTADQPSYVAFDDHRIFVSLNLRY